MKKYIITFFILLSFWMHLGCSRTVSSSEDLFYLDISINFRNTINLNDSIYVVAFSTLPNTPIEPQTIDADDGYFILPGKPYSEDILAGVDRDSVEDYYEDYFQTWTSYLYFSSDGTDFISSNTTSFNRTTTDNFTYTESIDFSFESTSLNSSTLQFTLDTEQIGLNEDDTVYFSFFSFDKVSDTSSGMIQDTITEMESITITLYEENNEIDSTDYSIDGDVDIVSWEAEVF